ncbi:hypothetical protein Cs7R123_63000 [Catellatospora sp. TT07R-123]|uniref:CHAT domain-containing protein n=1 Tax=Catellatospora sp. TT07R-123 TaxID=2733863 RepID=UPI001B107E5B|nr:CHAT domain-containing protein [Catellatospora sp. TT07R-123]GHJ48958.1 hypothetical protein Cs7R123_63000 [Catellatospora sp. TT07R-123]
MGDIVHGDKINGDKIVGDKVAGSKVVYQNPGQHIPAPRDGRGRDGGERAVVLMMSANPNRDAPLRLDEERRAIDQAIVRAQAEHRLAFKIADAVRVDDLSHCLLRHGPAIAHFSGHGTAADGLVFSDDHGGARPVPPDALAELFAVLSDGLRCVVLNACYSAEQARAIAEHVPYVVGMRKWIDDEAAILFSTGFYEGIAHGKSVPVAFALGRARLRLHGYTGQAPVLLAADGAGEEPVVPRS